MNTKELVDSIANDEMPKADVKRVVDSVFARITETIRSGEKVNIAGFGAFEVRSKPARKARNPRTGETVDVEASRKPVFKPAKALKESV